jgi:hypothetical protein
MRTVCLKSVSEFSTEDIIDALIEFLSKEV